jgi:hypothetical protein
MLFWDGQRKITTIADDGSALVYDFGSDSFRPRKRPGGPVLSKWRKHPHHGDIYLGWRGATGKPVVYRHGETGGVPPVSYTRPTLQRQINAAGGSPVVIKEGHYKRGPKLRGTRTVDFNWVSIDKMHNNGFVTVDGGPHVIRHLKLEKDGRAGIWGQNNPSFTLDGFEIQGQQFGILTGGSAGGHVSVNNGEIRDGRKCNKFGRCHNLYIGNVAEFTATNLKSLRHHGGGHLLKSRSRRNVIASSVFDGGESHHSRVLDFPCGGYVEIRDTVMIQSPNADNQDLMSIAVETKNCKLTGEEKHTLVLEDVRMIANKPKARVLTAHFPVEIICRGNNEFVNVDSICQ